MEIWQNCSHKKKKRGNRTPETAKRLTDSQSAALPLCHPSGAKLLLNSGMNEKWGGEMENDAIFHENVMNHGDFVLKIKKK